MAFSMWEALFLLVAVLVASTLGGVLGFGTAALLLPPLTLILGVRSAVPVLGLAMVMANASRALFSWRDIDWRAVAALSLGALPLTVLGATLFVRYPTKWINVALALLILALVPLRRLANRAQVRVRLIHLPWLGAGVGFASGIGGVVGPAATPFLLGYGLLRGSYLGTDGMNSTLMHGAKSLAYWAGGSLREEHLAMGLGLGGVMVVGSFAGRRLVDRIDPERYVLLVEIFLLTLGLVMLGQALGRR